MIKTGRRTDIRKTNNEITPNLVYSIKNGYLSISNYYKGVVKLYSLSSSHINGKVKRKIKV